MPGTGHRCPPLSPSLDSQSPHPPLVFISLFSVVKSGYLGLLLSSPLSPFASLFGFLKFTCECNCMVFGIYLSLSSFSINSFHSFHIIVNGFISSLLMTEWCRSVYIYHTVSARSSADGRRAVSTVWLLLITLLETLGCVSPSNLLKYFCVLRVNT